jgi:hypothetical protein
MQASLSVPIIAFTLAALSAVLCIIMPIILQDKLVSSQISDSLLTRDNLMDWGQVPGNSNFTITKQVTMYELQKPKDSDVLTSINVTAKATLNYNITKKLIPSEFMEQENAVTLDVVSYYHPDLSTKIKETEELIGVNLGALSAWYQFSNRADYKRITPLLYSILSDMRSNLAVDIMAREMYNYYCHDKAMVFSTILKNFTNKELIYSDVEYGMKSWQTLKKWLYPALLIVPSKDPMYPKIMDHFGFVAAEMDYIYNSKNNNMLLKLVQMMKNLMAQNYECKLRDCTDSEIVMNQFVKQIVTQTSLIDFNNVEPLSSYSDLEPDIIFPTEMAYFQKNSEILTEKQRKINLPIDKWVAIFNFDKMNAKDNLMNPANTQTFFTQMQGSAALNAVTYASKIKINDLDVMILIYQYMLYIIDVFGNFKAIQGKQSDSTFGLFSLNSLTSAVSYLADILPSTVFSRYLIADFEMQGYKCADILEKSKIKAETIQAICNHPGFNLKTLSSFETWFKVYNLVELSPDYQNIMSRFGLERAQMLAILNITNPGCLGSIIRQLVIKISAQFECDNKNLGCTAYELLYRQWGSSMLTSKIHPDYVKSPYLKSSFTINTWQSNTIKIPQEYYYWAKKLFPTESNLEITPQISQILLGTKLLKSISLSRFVVYSRNQNYDDIAKYYSTTHGKYIYQYLRYLTQYDTFSSAFNVHTNSEWLWGYTDSMLSQYANLDILLNGDPAYEYNMRIGPLNDTYSTTSTYPKSHVFTGHGDNQQTKSLYKLYGLNDIQVLEPYFDGKVMQLVSRNPYKCPVKANGTDGLQFSSDLKKESALSYFDQFFYIPLNLSFETKRSVNNVDALIYKIDSSNFQNNFAINQISGMLNITSVYKIPLMICQTNYSSVIAGKKNYLDGVTINGVPLNKLDTTNGKMEVAIEPYTGKTLEFTYDYDVATFVEEPTPFPSLPESIIPLMHVHVYGNYTNSEKDFSHIKERLKIIKIVRIGLISLGGACLLLAIALLAVYCIQSKGKGAQGSENVPLKTKVES